MLRDIEHMKLVDAPISHGLFNDLLSFSYVQVAIFRMQLLSRIVVETRGIADKLPKRKFTSLMGVFLI